MAITPENLIMLAAAALALLLFLLAVDWRHFRDWIAVFLFTCTLALLVGSPVCEMGLVEYPVRLFPEHYDTPVIFEAWVFPVLSVLYNQAVRERGPAAALAALPQHRPAAMLRSTATGWRSALAQRFGGPPATIPLVGRPGELATLTGEGYHAAYTAMAGPTWRNEIDAQVGVQLGSYRPAAKHAQAISCPILVQIADFDRGAPPQAAARAAFAARAEVRHYPCDHFDVFAAGDWFDHVVDHQIAFLSRHLVGAPATVTG